MRRLKTSEDARRFMAWTINEVLSGRMSAEKGKTFASLINTLLKAIEQNWKESNLGDLEDRLGRVEIQAGA